MEGRAIFKEHGGEQDDFRHSGGGLSLPALYRTPDELQQKLTQHVEGAHAHIEQLISVASDAMEQINLLQQHMRRVTVEYMPKGEYERIFGQLHVLNATQGERWKDIALQIIAIICDLERQYNPSDTGNDARVQSAEMMFDRAIRTVVNQLDTLLAKTFGVTRIPAEHNAGFNSKTMVAEPYEEELLSPDMAGNIAHVIEPGYWRKLPDGTLELYHRVRVRRYKSSQLHKEI